MFLVEPSDTNHLMIEGFNFAEMGDDLVDLPKNCQGTARGIQVFSYISGPVIISCGGIQVSDVIGESSRIEC